MEDIVRLRYSEHSKRRNEFLKSLVLLYPNIKPTQELFIFVPRGNSEALKIADLFATGAPNVQLKFEDEEEPHFNSEKTGASFDLMDATKSMLISQGIKSPFESNFVFPADVTIDLHDDLGIDDTKLMRLKQSMFAWNFDAHEYTADELLGVMFLLFKHLLSQPELPSEVNLTDEQLLWFLAVCRALYNPHVPYHSYWHSVDVSQFIVTLICAKPCAWQMDAATGLAVALAALGHDMKHPGIIFQVITCVDKKFSDKWESLEAYHLDVFEHVLDQIWPAIKKHWNGVVQCAIAATEMSKHSTYLNSTRNEKLSFVHALKISDFASSVRSDSRLCALSSSLIFIEFHYQSQLCAKLGPQYKFPKQKVDISMPKLDSLISLQDGFFKHIVLPYFEWLVERVPWFESYLKTARRHHQRFSDPLGKPEMKVLFNDAISILEKFY